MRKLLVLGAGALMLSGCAGGGTSAPSAPVAAAASPAILTAVAFVDVAGSAALYAVEAAKLAQGRSRDPQVRALAALQGANGEGIGGQLSYAGRRVNALPDNVMTPQHEAMLEALRTASDFDATYVAQQQELVPVMRLFHQDYAVRGGSATLRPVAEFSAEKLAEQLRALDALKD
ncbi:DUF4142 domain-containing protein [Sphingomicrobium arenosum]|uniref:DUF4142 domain-containing protein n=1 Tax=Sphingomicrobium arenosum TaxID=2233861 RepID=UPI002240F1E6|nr:DUF4142 domain-containing protein [Sphingomicrobium arenosum]